MHSTNYSTVSYHGWLAYLDFSLTNLYERDLYHQQSDVLFSIELLYEDHQCKSIREGTEPCGTP